PGPGAGTAGRPACRPGRPGAPGHGPGAPGRGHHGVSTPGPAPALMVGRLPSIFRRQTSIRAASQEHRDRSAGVAGLRIAVANWREPWHPEAGGAERYAWETGRRLAARGARVPFLTARAPGRGRRGRYDRITVVRMGGRFPVSPLALGWLLAHRRSF